MGKIYMLFFIFILAGCTNGNPMDPKDPTDDQYTSIAHIVEDVALGQHNYVGRTVKIKGVVEKAAADFTPISHKYQITIETRNSGVEFFILGDKAVPPLIEPNKPITEYKQKSSYDFYVFISQVQPHNNIQNPGRIISYLIVNEIRIKIDTFVSDVRLKNQEHRYIDNIIHLVEGAKVISEPEIIIPGEPDFDLPEKKYLKTNHHDVRFVVNDYTGKPNNLYKLKDGLNQDLTLFITSFYEYTDPIQTIRTRINSIIVWKN